MSRINAAVKKIKTPLRIAASVGSVQKKDISTEIGGLIDFDTANRFTYYQQLDGATPHASVSLDKLSLSLIKGMHFDSKSTRDKRDVELWAKKTHFSSQLATSSRLFCRDGTYLSRVEGFSGDNVKFMPLLMPNVTILPEDETPGDVSTRSDYNIMQPEVTQFVINEGRGKYQKVYNPEDVVYGTYNEWACVQNDVKNRKTYGIYGTSKMDTVELSIRNLLNINSGYVSFVKKYGNGRYQYDFKLLEKLVEQKIITYEAAQKAIDDWMESQKNLSENEDICSFGMGVIPLDASGSLNVLDFKKSLETDIQVGLLQSSLSMGDSKGSTYAAGYVSEADRMVVLEGLQTVFRESIASEMLARRQEIAGKNPDSVEIYFEELSLPELSPDVLLELANTGKIDDDELRERLGFSPREKTAV
jgi:hypothetical protein